MRTIETNGIYKWNKINSWLKEIEWDLALNFLFACSNALIQLINNIFFIILIIYVLGS